ncbi:MAG: cyclic pyranopterin monophosphate synthase MoaC [Deltaproteobacteria bacterium]|jgi:cyclic pyranopterin phosphate synthase
MSDELPHLDEKGAAHMVDVGAKDETHRVAVAESFVRLAPETVALLREGRVKKGDALAVARIAGIAASKKTSDLIPLAHPLSITRVAVDVEVEDEGVHIVARVETRGRTGVEMEALTSASVAALSLYDMIKRYERGATIERVRLLEKSGGQRGDYRRDD